MRKAHDIPASEQKALAVKFARLILHEGWSAAEVARRHEMPEHLPRYLMRKHGFGGVRDGRTPGRAEPPRFLRSDPQGRTPDDVLLMRRAGRSWTSIAVEFGVASPDNLRRVMRHWCRVNGRKWPVRRTQPEPGDEA